MAVNLFADSFGDNSGASVPEKGYSSLLAAEIGSIVNFSHGGDMWADQAPLVTGVAVADGDVSIIELGVNDQRIYLTDPAKLDYFIKGIMAHVGWLGCGIKTVARGSGGEVGTWADSTESSIGRTTAVVGSSKTFMINGYVAYVCCLRKDGQGGAFEVKIDGVSKGTFSTNALGMTTYNGKTYGPQLFVFPSLGPGQHSVEIKLVQDGKLFVEWATGSSDQTFRPDVYITNVTRSLTYQWGGSDANVATYNAALQGVIDILYPQGFKVYLVDISSVVDPDYDLCSDSLHPNDTGHLHIKNALATALNVPQFTVAKRKDGRVFVGGAELVVA